MTVAVGGRQKDGKQVTSRRHGLRAVTLVSSWPATRDRATWLLVLWLLTACTPQTAGSTGATPTTPMVACGEVDAGRAATTTAWATLTDASDGCLLRATVTCSDGKTHPGPWVDVDQSSFAECPRKHWIATRNGEEFTDWSWEFAEAAP